MLTNQHHLLHWERLGIYLIMMSNKPGEIRVVFDYLAEVGWESINRNLMTGPDLANQLIGVLMRFQEEHVAIMADIEVMFYQVKVAEVSCDSYGERTVTSIKV